MILELFKNLDLSVIEFCARFAQKSELVDKFLINVLSRPSFKFLPLVAILWFFWFDEKEKEKSRLTVINSFLSGTLAIITSRAIQNFLPAHPRPIHNNDLTQFVPPYGAKTKAKALEDWSSFPSDHAAIAAAICVCIFFQNKILGIFCFVFSFVVICLPRVYGGFHYTSDIMGGLFIGFLCVLLVKMFHNKLSMIVLNFAKHIETHYKQAFYAFAFILSFQVVTMFDDIRWPFMALIKNLNP